MDKISTISKNATNKITTMFKFKDKISNNSYQTNNTNYTDDTHNEFDYNEYKNMDCDNKLPQDQGRLLYRPMQPTIVRPLRTDENMMYVETSEINAISRDVTALSSMVQDMGVLLEVQGDQLNIVDEYVESSTVTVQNAGTEVNEAIRRGRNLKYKKGILATTGCTAAGAGIGFLGGPIGSVIGAGIGAGVGIIGSTIVGIVS
jgi:hypothetical protein